MTAGAVWRFVGRGIMSIGVDFAEFLLEEVAATLGGVVKPGGQLVGLTVIEEGLEEGQVLLEACEGGAEVIAVIEEDISPEGAIAAGDAGGIEKAGTGEG